MHTFQKLKLFIFVNELEMKTEKEKFNEYINDNYDRLMKDLKQACWFQTFCYSQDYFHDAILKIYDAIEHNDDFTIDYDSIDRLIFIIYKNIAINSDNTYNQRYMLEGDMRTYVEKIMYEELNIDDYYEPEYVQKIINAVYDYFDDEHIALFTNFMNGGSLKYRDGEERKLLEDIKYFLRFTFRKVHIKKQQKCSENCVPVLQYDIHNRYVKRWESIKQLADTYGVSRGVITDCIKNNKQRYGFYWRNGKRRNKEIQ